MARYDEWRGEARRRGYGWAAEPTGSGRAPGPGWAGGQGGRAGAYGSDFEGGRGGSYGGGRDEGFDRGGAEVGPVGVYGPARYGLGPYYQRLLDRRRPDEELREEVEEALFYDSWVDAEAISVEVEDGVVSLSGDLPSYEEVRYAIDDAWDVDGVRGVRSELRVR